MWFLGQENWLRRCSYAPVVLRSTVINRLYRSHGDVAYAFNMNDVNCTFFFLGIFLSSSFKQRFIMSAISGIVVSELNFFFFFPLLIELMSSSRSIMIIYDFIHLIQGILLYFDSRNVIAFLLKNTW